MPPLNPRPARDQRNDLRFNQNDPASGHAVIVSLIDYYYNVVLIDGPVNALLTPPAKLRN
jgi:hypothetical protein